MVLLLAATTVFVRLRSVYSLRQPQAAATSLEREALAMKMLRADVCNARAITDRPYIGMKKQQEIAPGSLRTGSVDITWSSRPPEP